MEGVGVGDMEGGGVKYTNHLSPPHDWETEDWRKTSHSIQGIANSAPMDYRQVIKELEESDLSKDQEMLGILDDIKQKSLFFGYSDGFEMSDTDLALINTRCFSQ